MSGLAALFGLVAVTCAALLERRLATSGPDTPHSPVGDLDARLRAGFPRAAAPWLVATAAAALTVAATLATLGSTAPALGALVAGAVAGALACRRVSGLLAAAQVGALSAAAWLAADPTLVWAPAALGSAGALASLVGVAAARVGPSPDDADEGSSEAPALARALVRPVVVSAALLLVMAELLVARLPLSGADDLRAPVGLGVVLVVALTAGAPWPLPGWGARGGGLLQVGALLRPWPVLVALVAAVAGLVLAVDGAAGLATAAATVAALSAGPLAAGSFCDRGSAPAAGPALRRRVGGVLVTLTVAAVAAALARPSADRPPPPDAAPRGDGPSMVGAPLTPERDE